MELCYFKSDIGNFGDDLNPYILNHFIPNFNSNSNNSILYFIGTILQEDFIGIKNIKDFDKKPKIVLGSGVRFINKPPKIDSSWSIRFLRGPLSSFSLLNNCNSYITDPAYLVREIPFLKALPKQKKYKISVMPHFFSIKKIDWAKLCNNYGVNFINPAEKNIDLILSEIAQSEVLITEAMHGAIIADALRVPWKRFKYCSHFYEGELVSEFKWSDWLFSMNLTHTSNYVHYNRIMREIDKRSNIPFFERIRSHFIGKSFEILIKDEYYQLSNDNTLDVKMDKLLNEIYLIKKIIS